MPISPDRLQRIRRFPELIDYLRDELDWPTEDFAFDDLTFEYEPAELGLKDEEAVKVKTIHQLRPLHQAQPWGIFFVEFGKKRLPIVVLRRVLRHLVFKKRASANKTERPAWQARDLLFISATGEDADRELTFAHFVEREDTGLAELRVLGWDTDDTPLHMNYVAATLSAKLRWRDAYERDPEAWRAEWSAAFLLRHRHVIRTSEELAAALAELARNLRARIRTILRLEDGFGEIRQLQRAFQTGLIHDLDDEGFADMFAQTVTYGLFSLACRRTIPGEGTAFSKDDLSHYFTSPFLKEMLGVFLGIKSRKGAIDFDELGVSDVTDLLTSPDTHMEVVLADFGNKTRGEDPVIHFYEHFLSAYNKQLKIQRGVFYTPQPVVSYIVRSVHQLLQTEFGLEDGLASTVTWGEMVARSKSAAAASEKGSAGFQPAVPGILPGTSDAPGEAAIPKSAGSAGSRTSVPQDAKHSGQDARAPLRLPPLTDEPGEKRTISPDEPFVQILDPATGTATFLVEVIDVIHRHLSERWKKGGLAAMPTLPSIAAPTAPFEPATPSEQAGGLTEISRGSSEPGERTPPDEGKKRSHPRGVPESPAPPPAPLRGASLAGAGSGGSRFASPPANFQQPSGLPAPRTFADYWNQYVPRALLPRLHAFELMMAPYAIAHMKIGLKLAETGYRFGTEERARIYLTNALEPKVQQLPQIGFDALAHEAAAVNEIKWYKRFTVVIGNPPYAGISSNMTEYAQRIVDAYRIVDGAPLNERKLWLQDDYVKFIRKAQTTIETARVGILGYITNHSYLDNPTFRGMRQSLIGTFQSIRLLDLHGNTTKKEQSPDGSDEKNVFDIKQGVAVNLATRGGSDSAMLHSDLWGSRDTKYAWLDAHSLKSTSFESLSPDSPFYFFDPQNVDFRAEYEEGWKVTDMMPSNTTGFVTARDHFVIGFSESELLERMSEFASRTLSDAEVRSRYFAGKGSSKYDDGDSRGWKLPEARKRVQADKRWKERVVDCLYRPLDPRKIYWCDWMVDWPRPEVTRHLLAGKNFGLNIGRAGQVIDQGRWNIVFCTRSVTEFNLFRRGGNSLFPLWLYPEQDGLSFSSERRPNFSDSFLKVLAAALQLPQKAHGLPTGLTPEDIFHYAYAVFHSPGYRSRYAEFLKIDFPRLPLTGNLKVFRALARLGGELTALHLLEAPQLATPQTTFVSPGSAGFQPAVSGILPGTANPAGAAAIPRNAGSAGRGTGAPQDAKHSGQDARAPLPVVEKPSWSHQTVWVDKAQTTGFRGVPEAVWNFHIGGYQVCQKWLKDRKGRTLSKDDLAHYQKIVIALSETIRLMAEIDALIEQHGGWPRAFSASTSAKTATA